MKQLYKYKSYDEYVKIQTKANKKKIKNTWAQPETLKLIGDYIVACIMRPTFGLCHGTRRGFEQDQLSKICGCDVLGTEISDTAGQFPNTIQWDFHEVREEWIGICDFIYSNSLDHSYDPRKALRAWLSCLKDDGILVIEWSEMVGKRGKKSNRVDPFFADGKTVMKMIENSGAKIVNVIETKNKKSDSLFLIFARPVR